MVERAMTDAEPRSGLTTSAPQRPDVGRGARPRRSGTGTTQPLGAPRGRPAWAGAALAPPNRSRSGDPGPEDSSPSRVGGQPWGDGSLGTRLGPPRPRPPGAVGRCRTGAAKARSPGWVALAGRGSGAAAGLPLGAWRAGWRAGGPGAGRGRSRGRRRPCPEPGSGAAVAAAERGCLEGAPGRRGVSWPPGPRRAGTDLPWDPWPRSPSLPRPVRPPAPRPRAVPVP